MASPLKGLLTPHILNIYSCLIHYLSQLQFLSDFTKLFALVEKISKIRETRKKFHDRSVKAVSHKHIVVFLTRILLSHFHFCFLFYFWPCKEVYLHLHVRFVSSKVAEVFIGVNC